MDRYTFFFAINLPFILFGVLRAFEMFRTATVALPGLLTRLLFWLSIALSLAFSRSIYVWLYHKNLVNTPLITITTIMLSTGVIFSFFLILRIYMKVEQIEIRQTELLTQLSIIESETVNTPQSRRGRGK